MTIWSSSAFESSRRGGVDLRRCRSSSTHLFHAILAAPACLAHLIRTCLAVRFTATVPLPCAVLWTSTKRTLNSPEQWVLAKFFSSSVGLNSCPRTTWSSGLTQLLGSGRFWWPKGLLSLKFPNKTLPLVLLRTSLGCRTSASPPPVKALSRSAFDQKGCSPCPGGPAMVTGQVDRPWCVNLWVR